MLRPNLHKRVGNAGGLHYGEVDVLEVCRVPLTNNTTPLLFRGVIASWPAVSRWSLDYFALQFPEEMIRLERFDPKSAAPYLEQTVQDDHKDVSFERLRDELTVGRVCYAVRENTDIFRQIPSLLEDLEAFRPFPVAAECYKSLWIGPAGYVTGMHTDPGPTLVFQIRGCKRVLLFAPSESERVYAVKRSEVKKRFSNTPLKRSLDPSELKDLAERTGWADVQPFTPDFRRYPLFANAQGVESVLQSGDTLYIPDGWWHAVMGLDLTISVAAEPNIVEAQNQT